MRSEFQIMCATARERIVTPAIPLDVIRSAAARPATPEKGKRRKRFIAGILSGLVVVGAAAAAEIWKGTHVSFGPSGALQMSTIEEFRVANFPNEAELCRIVARATFPVQLPAGLPPGTILGQVGYGPSFIELSYNLPGAWRRSNHLLKIALVDPRSLTATTGPHAWVMRMGGLAATGAVRWNIGHEIVIVMNSMATPAEIENIHRTMLREASNR